MKISLRVAFNEHSAVRLLNWLALENALILDESRGLPLLYRSNVRYARERQEIWCDYPSMLAQGVEDCDGLAAARAGELISRGWRALHPSYLAETDEELKDHGIDPWPTGYAKARKANLTSIPAEVFLRTRVPEGGSGLYHCVVRYRVGKDWYFDDPSARLGMYRR